MPTLESIYRDVNSRLSDLPVDTEKIVHLDVVKAINDSIRSLQLDYVKNGLADVFSVSEYVDLSDKDSNYPFLYSVTLSNNILSDTPLSFSVLNALVTIADSIPDAPDTFSKGDRKIKDNVLYEAVVDGSGINAYDLTFEADNVRNYKKDNGLTYTSGDIVYNQPDDTFWRCDSSYTNDQSETISESGFFTQLYWKKVGEAYRQAQPIDFENLFQLKLFSGINSFYPFTIKDDTLYTTHNLTYYITYVPEWQQVEDLSVEINLPDAAINQVKTMTLQKLAQKLQVSAEIFKSDEED